MNPSKLLAVGDIQEPGLYIMRTQDSITTTPDIRPDVPQAKLSLNRLHNILCHRHKRDCRKLSQPGKNGRKALLEGCDRFDDDDNNDDDFCSSCAIGKAKKFALPKKTPGQYVERELSELIHTDVCGPFRVMSIAVNAYYFVTFPEDRSRKRFSYLIQNKSEVFDRWRKFSTWIERRTGNPIKALRYDNAGEYLSTEFPDRPRTARNRVAAHLPQQLQPESGGRKMEWHRHGCREDNAGSRPIADGILGPHSTHRHLHIPILVALNHTRQDSLRGILRRRSKHRSPSYIRMMNAECRKYG